MAKKHEKTEIPSLARVSAFFSVPESSIQTLITDYPIEQLKPTILQPRKYFDKKEISQLAESIKHCGILEPILVTSEVNGERTILAGERRYRAAQLAGLKKIPIYQLDLAPDIASQVPLIENLLRRDLTPFEELEGYLTLLEHKLHNLKEFKEFSSSDNIKEEIVKLLFAMRNAEVGRRTPVAQTLVNNVIELFQSVGSNSWQSFVTHRLSLRKLPAEIQEALQEGWLEYTKAIEISRLTDKKLGNIELASQHRMALLNRAKQENLSIREIKDIVNKLLINANKPAMSDTDYVKARTNTILTTVGKKYSKLTGKQKEKLNQLLSKIENMLG